VKKKIIIATKNQGKFREILEILKDIDAEFLTLNDFPEIEEIEEDGYSYLDNALKKAGIVCEITGIATIAEDSGLEVDALGGMPGIFSARYAGFNASDADRIAKLLGELKHIPDEKRTARYFCSAVFATPSGGRHVEEGTCEGTILKEPRGSGGFGYDPVFYVPELKRTMAELPLSVKNNISHRGKAIRKLKEKVLRWTEGEKITNGDYKNAPETGKDLDNK